ncbi:MAG TPA: exodeoxyribonuclease V subunit gamma [Desulfomonilia bacterium]
MPGLYLHSGNSLSRLSERLTDIIRINPPETPLEPETILVQSRGMQRWLSMRLSEGLGIASNFRFPFPNAFINELFERVLGSAPDKRYAPERLLFAVMGIIEAAGEEKIFKALKKYISGDDTGIRLVQLSEHIADAFDQYLIFRPEIILGWENDKRFFADGQEKEAEEWQAIIWKKIISGLGPHPAGLKRDLIARLISEKPLHHPERISMFGISHLPNFHLEILKAYALTADVHVFVLNPCRQYWMDIESERNILGKEKKAGLSSQELHLETGNSLLASMGKQGGDFLGYLYGQDETITDEEGLWEEPDEATVLGRIKKGILDLSDGNDSSKRMIDPRDESIAVHSCHSPMREVEVLRDNILSMFEKDPSLKPEEILVMSPDINMYAPYVEAVFGGETGSGTYIPFNISDTQEIERPLSDGFFGLLGLSDRRFRASHIISLLDEPVIRTRFDITDDETTVIREWISAACIRWGIDAENRKGLGFDATGENTWRAGLDSLLLGYAMPGGILYKGILTAHGIEGERAHLLGRFLTFTDMAFHYGMRLSEKLDLNEWKDLLLKMVDDMLDTSECIQGAASLRSAISELAQTNGYHGRLCIQAVEYLIKTSIRKPVTGRFLTKGVTFCSLLPMRSIPMKIICLIGINDDAYPRQDIPAGFNLIRKNPRKGDRSLRDDDRYLFLESIISAGKRLYISYTGQDIRDNSKRPPSVLVSELLDHIKANFYIDGLKEDDPDERDKAFEDRFVTKHRLQGFSPKYFTGEDGRLFSYSKGDCETAKALIRKDPIPIKPFICSPVKCDPAEFRNLSAETLAEFFRNPVRFFLRRRLGISIRGSDEEIEDREAIKTGSLQNFKISQTIVESLMKETDPLPLLMASGLLPHGSLGEALYRELLGQAKELIATVMNIAGSGPTEIKAFELNHNGRVISGSFELKGGCPFSFRPSVISAKHILNAWLTHVMFNVLNEGGTSLLAGFEKKDKQRVPAVIRFGPLTDPEKTLGNILELFSSGISRPVHFFPEISMNYVESIRKKGEDKAFIAAKNAWIGNDFDQGEKDKDPYYLIYPGETSPIDEGFKEASAAFFSELLENCTWEEL